MTILEEDMYLINILLIGNIGSVIIISALKSLYESFNLFTFLSLPPITILSIKKILTAVPLLKIQVKC